jgi:cytosine/creatinine deaminase
MTDLILRNARIAGLDGLADVAIDSGVISAIDRTPAAPSGGPESRPAAAPASLATEAIDLAGCLVTPPLVEPHIHLDAVLTVGQPRPNVSGSLFEGIAVWAERLASLSYDDVQQRAQQVLRWQLACGVQHVRSHVDVCDPQLRALRALIDLREEVRGLIDLQLVAFPQQGILAFDGGTDLMRRAVELGADVVGGIPHYELTREDGVESVKFAMALADEHELMVDIHCDETDDDHSRFIEVMAAETIKRGMSGRVTASHTTAMHSYNSAYAYRLISNIARAGLHMVTNPLDNSVLQGRFDIGPIRRGHTRVKQLLDARVNVCIGHDSVMDPWYPLGYGDPLQAAFVLVHLGQMSGDAELRQLIEMITTRPAAALGLTGYGLRAGGPADLVVFGAPSEADALRLIAPRTLVLRAGKVVARATPAQHTVTWLGTEQPVTFLRG